MLDELLNSKLLMAGTVAEKKIGLFLELYLEKKYDEAIKYFINWMENNDNCFDERLIDIVMDNCSKDKIFRAMLTNYTNSYIVYLLGRFAESEGDYETAFVNYGLSADEKNPMGEHKYGSCHFHGWGTDVNYGEALALFKRSAEKGYDRALYRVGFMNQRGFGTVENAGEAFKYYKLCADTGNSCGCAEVGSCFKRGYGTDKNMNEAYKYFKIGADVAEDKCYHEIACLYLNHRSSFNDEEKKEMLKYMHKYSETGDKWGHLCLGLAYQDNKNIDEAIKFLTLSANKGHELAIHFLGLIHMEKEEYVKAYHYFKSSLKYEDSKKSFRQLWFKSFFKDDVCDAMHADLVERQELKEKTKKLEVRVKELEEQIEELQLRPPPEGGKLYVTAKENFEKS